MSRYYWLLIAPALLSACRQKEAGPVVSPDAAATRRAAPVLFHKPGTIDSSGMLYYTLGGKTYGDGAFSSSSRDYGSVLLWNILFVNTRTGEQYLLDTGKMLIRNMHMGGDAQKQESKDYPCIFYEMITDDRNRDKDLDAKEDPVYLFVSDRYGRNLRRLSPVGHTLLEWIYVKEAGKVYMTVRPDSNNNGVFDEKDEQVLYEAAVQAPGAPAPLLGNALKEQVSRLYERDWK